MYFFCVVLCDVCFVTFPVLFVCICVLYYCHRVATQLQLNISYHITSIFIKFFPADGLLSRCSLSDGHDSSRNVAHVHRLTHCAGLKCCDLCSESVQGVTTLFSTQNYCRRSSLLFCNTSTVVWVAILISIQITLHGVATMLFIQITVQGVATLISIQTPSSHTVRDA
jgi:hypothetical protein